jgi:hypothetical protein
MKSGFPSDNHGSYIEFRAAWTITLTDKTKKFCFELTYEDEKNLCLISNLGIMRVENHLDLTIKLVHFQIV